MKTSKGNRKDPDPMKVLKSWVQWVQTNDAATEHDLLMAAAVNDLFSQVGTWKAKYEALAQAQHESEPTKFHSSGYQNERAAVCECDSGVRGRNCASYHPAEARNAREGHLTNCYFHKGKWDCVIACPIRRTQDACAHEFTSWRKVDGELVPACTHCRELDKKELD